MRYRNLDLNLLVALDTLIRLRNVSRAADEMNITQSAMSNALSRMREYFEDPLLIQVGRRMELSPLADTLAAPIRDIMVRVETAVASTPSFDPATAQRTVSIALSDYSMLTLMPRWIPQLEAAAPGIRLRFHRQDKAPHQLLEQGDADLLIAPTGFLSTQHPSEVLWSDPLCCLVAEQSSHPKTQLSRALFESVGHVVMVPPTGESYAVQACKAAGLSLRVEITTYAFAAIGELVRDTSRIALVQARLAQKFVQSGGLRIVQPPVALPPLQQWHTIRSQDPCLMWLCEQLRLAAAPAHGDPSVDQAVS